MSVATDSVVGSEAGTPIVSWVGVTPRMSKSWLKPGPDGPTFTQSNVSRLKPEPLISSVSPLVLASCGLTDVIVGGLV